jgi:hypothetical protein
MNPNIYPNTNPNKPNKANIGPHPEPEQNEHTPLGVFVLFGWRGCSGSGVQGDGA